MNPKEKWAVNSDLGGIWYREQYDTREEAIKVGRRLPKRL